MKSELLHLQDVAYTALSYQHCFGLCVLSFTNHSHYCLSGSGSGMSYSAPANAADRQRPWSHTKQLVPACMCRYYVAEDRGLGSSQEAVAAARRRRTDYRIELVGVCCHPGALSSVRCIQSSLCTSHALDVCPNVRLRSLPAWP